MEKSVAAFSEAVGVVEEQSAAGKAINLKPLVAASRLLAGTPKGEVVETAFAAMEEALPLLGARVRREGVGGDDSGAGELRADGGSNRGSERGGGDGGGIGEGAGEGKASVGPTAAPAADAPTARTAETAATAADRVTEQSLTGVKRLGRGRAAAVPRKARPVKPSPPSSSPMPAAQLASTICASLDLPRAEAFSITAVVVAGLPVISDAYAAAAALRTPWSPHPRARMGGNGVGGDGMATLGQVWRLFSLIQMPRLAEMYLLSALIGGPHAATALALVGGPQHGASASVAEQQQAAPASAVVAGPQHLLSALIGGSSPHAAPTSALLGGQESHAARPSARVAEPHPHSARAAAPTGVQPHATPALTLLGEQRSHATPVAWEAFALGLARIAHAFVAGPHSATNRPLAPRLQRLLAFLHRGLRQLDTARAAAMPPHPTLAAFHRRRSRAWAHLLGLLSSGGASGAPGPILFPGPCRFRLRYGAHYGYSPEVQNWTRLSLRLAVSYFGT
jgi:hypothetical protein